METGRPVTLPWVMGAWPLVVVGGRRGGREARGREARLRSGFTPGVALTESASGSAVELERKGRTKGDYKGLGLSHQPSVAVIHPEELSCHRGLVQGALC